MFKLVISDDEGKTTVVPLVRDEITIGRKEGNTIRLTERNVSRRHARLQKSSGNYTIEDLGSYNGVKINGRRIEAEAQTPLSPGDQVTIGDYVIALQSEASTEAMPAPPVGMEQQAVPPRLVMLTPPAPGAEFALTRDGMRIGRAEDLEIWINHRSISREHAVVRLDGEQIRVEDLESANGMRLNGKDVAQCVLSSGDVLELGQVRFRFVGEGEAYVFEADRTVQMDAIDLPTEPARSNNTTMWAGLIILVAVIIGAAIALGGSSDPEPDVVTVENPDTELTNPPDTNNQGPTPEEAANAAIEDCQTALGTGDFAAAVGAANRALELHPTSAGAAACKTEAEANQRAEATFARGVLALEREEYDTAYFAFEELPEDSPLRERPQAVQARQSFIEHNLTQAEAVVGENPAEAMRFANAVLTTPDLSREHQRRANDVLRQALRQNGGGGMRVSMGMSHMVAIMETTMVVEPPVMMESGGGSVDPSEVMRSCNFDQRCIVRGLRGRANTVRAMGVLIEAYKAIGDRGNAERSMRELIQRWPGSRQANTYRRQL